MVTRIEGIPRNFAGVGSSKTCFVVVLVEAGGMGCEWTVGSFVIIPIHVTSFELCLCFARSTDHCRCCQGASGPTHLLR